MELKPMNRTAYPMPDVICAGDTYYMLVTTAHYLPGGQIFRSYNLIHWEIAGCVFDRFESRPEECLEAELSIYGKGLREATLRYYNRTFYACFSECDTGTTWLYTAEDVAGPWQKTKIGGILGHHSLLFDDNGKCYIVWGRNELRITELAEDLSAPKKGGLDQKLPAPEAGDNLWYGGAHCYKLRGAYALLLTYYRKEDAAVYRIMAAYTASDPGADWKETVLPEVAVNEENRGNAPGGVLEAPDGKWYYIVFRYPALTEQPLLLPVRWEENLPLPDMDAAKKTARKPKSNRPNYEYAPLFSSELFTGRSKNGKPELAPVWQWNHEPNDRLWRRTEDGGLAIKTNKISLNLLQAVNTLTQQIRIPASTFEVSLDMTGLGSGDFAGIAILQGAYGWIGVTKEIGRYFLVMQNRRGSDGSDGQAAADFMPGNLLAKFPYEGNLIRLKIKTAVTDTEETAEFFFRKEGVWEKLGAQKLYYRQEQMVGCRFGMFIYSTIKTGGEAVFYNVEYTENA